MIATNAAWPTLHTERLALRALRPEDAGDLSQLVDDLSVARMTTAIPHPFPAGAADDFIQRMTECDGRREGVFAIDVRERGFAGVLGFHPDERGVPEIGYWLGRPYWGCGYMTEAVRAALGWAGGGWGKRYLMSGHFADNPASGAVLIKAGFLYTGDVLPRFSAARGEEAPTRMMVWLA
jgi:RimJ/RimL family protein N-acetyltransferase